jgi:hypothetical protein
LLGKVGLVAIFERRECAEEKVTLSRRAERPGAGASAAAAAGVDRSEEAGAASDPAAARSVEGA